MTIENLEGVMRRIQKLLAIAQDDRANPAEAAAAASMAEKVMRKYQLDHADILLASMKRGDDMGTEDCVATAKTNGTAVKVIPPWANWIAVQVAYLHDCGARQTKVAADVAIRFYGFKTDVQIAAWTYSYLIATVNRLCRQFREAPEYIIGGRKTMNSYRLGVSTGILQALKKLIAEKAAEMQQASSSRALVLTKTQAVAERFGAMVTHNTGTKQMRDVHAYSKGVIDGRSVDVARRAVGASSSNVLAIQ